MSLLKKEKRERNWVFSVRSLVVFRTKWCFKLWLYLLWANLRTRSLAWPFRSFIYLYISPFLLSPLLKVVFFLSVSFFFCIIFLLRRVLSLFISIRFFECRLVLNSLRGVRKIDENDCWLRHICPSRCSSVRLELCFHWRDFHEILYLSVFRKSVKKVKILLKSKKNNEYFTRITL